jgi:ABC-2 type transport system permease protein
MRSADAVRLVARREIVERVRERSFLISTSVMAIIVVLVIALSALFGSDDVSDVGVTDPVAMAVGRAAADAARASGTELRLHPVSTTDARAQLADGSLDAVLGSGAVLAQDKPDQQLVALLQSANRQVSAQRTLRRAGVHGATLQRALAPPPLRVASVKPQDKDADTEAGLAFFIVLLLYGQLLTYGYWVAAGVVEEKSSRVIEIVLSTLRPRQLLAGKVLGLGLLALGHLTLIALIGLGAAAATGALDVSGELVRATALALAWFVAGYAFYACAFACAGALVPRQEEIQSATMPLTLVILVSFFISFAVNDNPDGTLAHVTAFIPMTAPLTMPGRIVTGDASTLEVVVSYGVTLLAAALLIPLAARIYEGGVLRTGSAIKLRDAWRSARA